MYYTTENPATKITRLNRALRLLCVSIAFSTLALPSKAAANSTQPEVFQPSVLACDFQLAPSEQTYQVGAGCTVMGDVQFGPNPDELIKIYSSNEGTGFSVTLKRPSQ